MNQDLKTFSEEIAPSMQSVWLNMLLSRPQSPSSRIANLEL